MRLRGFKKLQRRRTPVVAGGTREAPPIRTGRVPEDLLTSMRNLGAPDDVLTTLSRAGREPPPDSVASR
jgi:hypothetical protein